MKIPLITGLLMALAGFMVSVGLTLSGMHADVAHMPTAQHIQTWTGIAIVLVGLLLGIRACRADTPPEAPYTYGKAVGAGAKISLWYAIFAAVFAFGFFMFINPDLRETMIQAQLDAMAAKGLSTDKAEGMIRTFMSLPVLTIMTVIMTMVFGMIGTVIVAAFLRRPAAARPVAPPVAAVT